MKRRFLPLLVLPMLFSVLAMGCGQANTLGITPVPRSKPNIEATVQAAVAATISATSGTRIPTADPKPLIPSSQMPSSQITDADRVQATLTALLATPPVSALGASSVTPIPPESTPRPTSTPLPTVIWAPTRVPTQALPTLLPAPTAIRQVVTPPTPTTAVQPTPTVPLERTWERNCQLALDGMPVTAWIDGAQVASGQVADGSYFLIVKHPEGGAFAGRTVTFKIGEFAAEESATWIQGGGDELDLTANSGPGPASSITPASPSTQQRLGGLLAQPLPPHIFLGTASLCELS